MIKKLSIILSLTFSLLPLKSFGKRYGFVLQNNEFQANSQLLTRVLPMRGFETPDIISLSQFTFNEFTSRLLSKDYQQNDQVFVFISCHGGLLSFYGEESEELLRDRRICCFDQNCVTIGQLEQSFEMLINRTQIKPVVLDTSCGSGGSVKYLGQRQNLCTSSVTSSRTCAYTSPQNGNLSYLFEALETLPPTSIEDLTFAYQNQIFALKRQIDRYQFSFTTGCGQDLMDFSDAIMKPVFEAQIQELSTPMSYISPPSECTIEAQNHIDHRSVEEMRTRLFQVIANVGEEKLKMTFRTSFIELRARMYEGLKKAMPTRARFITMDSFEELIQGISINFTQLQEGLLELELISEAAHHPSWSDQAYKISEVYFNMLPQIALFNQLVCKSRENVCRNVSI